MLFLETIHRDTFNLLQKISQIEAFDNFALAGGTALALQLGHRISIDLDFFTQEEFDSENLKLLIENHFEAINFATDKNSLSAYIKHESATVKVDFIRHNYPAFHKIINKDNIRMYALEEIVAMKLNAIKNRGAKKDFYDIYEILQHYSVATIIEWYLQKYQNLNLLMLLKSLTYFVDADNEPNPISLRNISWDVIKKQISIKTENYIDAQTK
jgi:predicted nucleotidyltransferase component of viral defense system